MRKARGVMVRRCSLAFPNYGGVFEDFEAFGTMIMG